MGTHETSGEGVPSTFITPDGQLLRTGPYQIDPPITPAVSSDTLPRITPTRLKKLTELPGPNNNLQSAPPPVLAETTMPHHNRGRIGKAIATDTLATAVSSVLVLSSAFMGVWIHEHRANNPTVQFDTDSRSPVDSLQADIRMNAELDYFSGASLTVDDTDPTKHSGKINLSLGKCILQGVTIITRPQVSAQNASSIPNLPVWVTDITAYQYSTPGRTYTFVNQNDLQNQVGDNPCAVLGHPEPQNGPTIIRPLK